MNGDPRTPSDTPLEPDADTSVPGLAMLLTGDLPCIGCGYDIRGLSVLSQCPECGLAVRATVLHRVDPGADALRPMPTPWLTSIGILGWTGFGLIAALMLWAPRVSDLLDEISAGAIVVGAGWATPLALASIVASGVGMVGMIRPIVGVPRSQVVMGVAALALYPLIALSVHRVAALSMGSPPYLAADPSPARITWRLTAAAAAAAMLLLIRPSARELVKRSLVLRTKRVDRQTIYATVGALGVTALGDVLRLIGASGLGPEDWLSWVGGLVVLVGSVLVTLALGGAALDGWRIAHSILAPSPTPAQALRRSGQ